jgi:HSP90 family molecular chaperone
LAKTSSDNIPKFNISAAVVRQLGEELVTEEVTAVMELVKNSYDADASWVKIDVNSKQSLASPKYHYNNDRGYISIADNGFGMTESDIVNGWMVISLSGKRKMKALGQKTAAGRTPLGDKGLGRLSTQRLGNRLEMFSTHETEEHTNHVAFDWDDFTEDVALTDVPTMFAKTTKESTTGTTLIVRNLKDPSKWY